MYPHSLLRTVSDRDVRLDPFPHVVVKGALDPAFYATLVASFPPPELITKGKDAGSNKRFDYLVSDIRAQGAVGEAWVEFCEYHASVAFFHDVVRVFGPAIEHLYPGLTSELGPFSDWQVGVRKEDTHDTRALLMDAHISINTPVTAKPTSVRAVHVDDPRKLFAGLFYMRHPADDSMGGNLELYRWVREDYRFDRQQTFARYVEPVATVPYEPNTLVFLLNSINSLHGVTPRQRTTHPRTFVNLVGEVKNPLFDIESRQISRLHKRLRKILTPHVYDYR